MRKSGTAPLPLGWRSTPTPEYASSGIPDLDAAFGGFPRGRISEITGPLSSGRTTLLNSILAAATQRGEQCILIDTRDSFDPPSASARGVVLEKLIWIRCRGNVDHALRSADLVVQSGGFGVIALDLAEAPVNALRRIPSTAWFRFRRAVEPTSTLFVVTANRPLTGTCASVLMEMRRRSFKFLCKADFQVTARKPVRKEAGFCVRLHPLAAG